MAPKIRPSSAPEAILRAIAPNMQVFVTNKPLALSSLSPHFPLPLSASDGLSYNGT